MGLHLQQRCSILNSWAVFNIQWQAVEKLAGLLKLPDNLPWRAQQNGRFGDCISISVVLTINTEYTFWSDEVVVEYESTVVSRFLPLASPLSPAPLILLPCHGLKGGKGGFGNMLRAIGAQVCLDSNSQKSLSRTD